jgi:hypothetical protein
MSTAKKVTVSLAGAKSGAVPDSPGLRIAPFKPNPPRHVQGQRVPDGYAHLVPFENTDEGIAEKRKRKTARTSIVSDPLDKAIQQRRDFRTNELEPWESPDPMKELADAHVGPGMRPGFLSPRVIARQGMRGYKAVIVDGEPVKLGDMILGEIPEEKAAGRQEHYRRIGQDRLTEMHETFQEGQEQIMRTAGRSRSAKRGSEDDSGLQEVRGNAADEGILR